MKSHPSYTTAIGEDCRIVAPVAAIPATEPTLKAIALTSYQVKLTFAMNGHDQLEIHSKRGSEYSFSILAFDTNTPYIDARLPFVAGQPEQRQYRARFINDDSPTGDWSDIVTVSAHE